MAGADGEPRVITTDDVRRLQRQSRVRLAAVESLREQQLLICRRSRERLDASRRLLEGPASTRCDPSDEV